MAIAGTAAWAELPPEQEARRLVAVRRYDILDTPPDGAFDRIAALAAGLFQAPMSTVTIVDTDRVWFKATHGLLGVTQLGRDPGLSTSALLADNPLVIPDTLDAPTRCSPRTPYPRPASQHRFRADSPHCRGFLKTDPQESSES